MYHRKVHRPPAVLRDGTDALGPVVPLQGRRAYRAADRGQRVEPCGIRWVYLFDGLRQIYKNRQSTGLDGCSQRALARIRQAMRFSRSLTTVLHRFPGASDHGRRIQDTNLAHLEHSPIAQKLMAENDTGLPY